MSHVQGRRAADEFSVTEYAENLFSLVSWNSMNRYNSLEITHNYTHGSLLIRVSWRPLDTLPSGPIHFEVRLYHNVLKGFPCHFNRGNW